MAESEHESRAGSPLERMAVKVTEAAGSSYAFALAVIVIVAWALAGPLFGFSDTWQLVVNTGTTIVTFLMVFLIQRAQNKEARALHLKLNEIIAGLQGASNRLINIEDSTEAEVRVLHDHYEQVVGPAKHDPEMTRSHSIEEAESPDDAARSGDTSPREVASPHKPARHCDGR